MVEHLPNTYLTKFAALQRPCSTITLLRNINDNNNNTKFNTKKFKLLRYLKIVNIKYNNLNLWWIMYYMYYIKFCIIW